MQQVLRIDLLWMFLMSCINFKSFSL
jgi:hypothetical protein